MNYKTATEHYSAEFIAQSLNRCHRVGEGRYISCCPAHDDRTPSFSITQHHDRILVHCFGGCSQRDVIDALQHRGLWPKASTQTRGEARLPPLSRGDLDYMATFTLMYRSALLRNEEPSFKDTRLYYAIADRLATSGVEL